MDDISNIISNRKVNAGDYWNDKPMPTSIARSYSVPSTPPGGVRNVSSHAHIGPRNKADEKLLKGKPDYTFDIGQGITGAGNLALNLYDAAIYNKSVDDLLMDAGTSFGQRNGINFQRQNVVSGSELANVKGERFGSTINGATSGATAGMAFGGPVGAAIGAVAGGIGGFVGNIFKTNSAKKKIEAANYLATNTNRIAGNTAATQGMQLDFYNQYGNPEKQVLYADNGKDLGRLKMGNNMRLTQTNSGFQFAPHNAYGKGGEVIGSPSAGQWDVIRGDGKDNKPLHVEDEDVVITDKFGLAEAAIPSVVASKQLSGAMDYLQLKANSQKGEQARNVANNAIKKHLQELQQEKDMHDQRLANIAGLQRDLRNKGFLPQETVSLPHAKNGLEAGNLINGLIGIGTGISQYIGASRQKIKRPYTYAPNIYGNRALQVADALRVDTKPIIDQIDRESAGGRYRIATAGGLSGAQRYLANVANIYNTQIAKADALAKADLQNNQYRSNYAEMLAKLGAQDATARMQTNQWDLDYYSKAHAAKLQGQQMGVYNMLNQLQQYTANANKLGMFRDMRALYAADLEKDKQELLKKNNPRLYNELFGNA